MSLPIPENKDVNYFAKVDYRNVDKTFGIKRKDRRQHMYVLGKSGGGKSTLISNLIVQDIKNGEGLCFVDPHGDGVEEIVEMIPDYRLDDVIYFNPADTEFHMGFNVLEVTDPRTKHLVASGLMGIFTKIWANVWSSRMEYILNNCILALVDTPGTSLLGIPRVLVDTHYRKVIVDNITDPVVRSFWVNEYEVWQERFRNEAIAPIQNKVGQFLSTPIVRNIVGQSKSTINIYDIMNQGKIFLANLAHGRIGEDTSALLGGMLITKIQLSAMERVKIPEAERKDFYLYVDEFQNFATESFASILSEARKYRLCLILAHQYIAQLVSPETTSVRDAAFGNVGTMIIFRIGAADAEFLEKEFDPEFTPQDFVNLPNYHIYLKLMVDGVTSRPFSAVTLPPLTLHKVPDAKAKIIERSRALYMRAAGEVAEEISEWSKPDEEAIEAARQAELAKKGHEAQCDVCGKTIHVPFKPKPGLPVYCKEDLEKVKSGEITRAQLTKLKLEREKKQKEAEKAEKAENAKSENSDAKADIPERKPAADQPAAPVKKPAISPEKKKARPAREKESRPKNVTREKRIEKPLNTNENKDKKHESAKSEQSKRMNNKPVDFGNILDEALSGFQGAKKSSETKEPNKKFKHKPVRDETSQTVPRKQVPFKPVHRADPPKTSLQSRSLDKAASKDSKSALRAALAKINKKNAEKTGTDVSVQKDEESVRQPQEDKLQKNQTPLTVQATANVPAARVHEEVNKEPVPVVSVSAQQQETQVAKPPASNPHVLVDKTRSRKEVPEDILRSILA